MGFEMKLLALPAYIQADEMSQMLQWQLAFDLHLEGQWPAAIRPGLLAHLHHKLTSLWLGEDQLTTDGEEIVPLRQGINKIRLIRGQRARLPDAGDLEM